MKKPATGMYFLLFGALLTICLPIAALAADVPSLNAAAGFATDSFTLILKIGVPSGLISGLITLLVAYWNNKAAQKNNREKIAAEAENISLQLSQRQNEFETQTKLQIESLHSAEKKKICADFLACTNPTLFLNDSFDIDKVNSSLPFIYLYCKEEYFLYFKNVVIYIKRNSMSTFGKKYVFYKRKIKEAKKELEAQKKQTNYDDLSSTEDLDSIIRQIDQRVKQKEKLHAKWKIYTRHYKLALEAAQKMIWNEPIEEAQPLQRKKHSDEDE